MTFESIKFSVQGGLDFSLPEMLRIRQHFDSSHISDPAHETRIALEALQLPCLRGKKIGITAGSRRIANLPVVLGAVGQFLREAGAQPVIIPAMGSHGGASADGQTQLLANLGITEQTAGMPIESCMETEKIGVLPNGFPVWCSKTALSCDGILVCGRVKPHTSIRGQVESGLCKMMAVGLGKHRGAAEFHRQGYTHLAELLPQIGQVFLDSGKIIGGLALIENALDQTAVIQAVSVENFIAHEASLLEIARQKMPRFFMDEIDVLVVKRFGKDISGAGMDPNITGRSITPLPMSAPVPIKVIVALELTPASHGNATGIGGADITTRHVVEQIDFGHTYTNVLTSGALAAARLPIVAEHDLQAIRAAMHCVPRENVNDVKLVCIDDTLHMTDILVSANYLPILERNERIKILGKETLHFDKQNRLL